MDWVALRLSLLLSLLTCLLLIPPALWIARRFAWHPFRGRGIAEALVALPLVLPPTVLGYYLLVALGGDSPLGRWYQALTGETLVFSFRGLVVASLLFNLPFAVQPMQRAFEGVPRHVREAAWCSGLSNWRTFWRIELPLAWPGVVGAIALVFAHTLGEFGVVLMVGGNIPGETRTVAIAVYDQVQAFDLRGAGIMSLALLGMSMAAMAVVFMFTGRRGQ
jgi:molybdate transport system permease protein